MENLNWSELGFGYIKTDYNVRCYYRDGKWGELEVSSSEIINIHMAATCLHYGQESFEGLKAFRGKDGKIRVFRMDENAKRMQSSSRGIKMAELPVEMFEEAVRKVVKLNERFVPPYESGAALYIRPLMIGLGAQVGVKPAPEYMFMIFVTPVGPYFKGGFQPSKVCVLREYDRAAPNGTGTIKVGGNYAASLVAGEIAHSKGYAAVLYLDPKEKKYLDELELKESDIVICSTGAGTLGRVGQIFEAKENLTFDSHVTLIRTNGQVGQQYLFWTLKMQQDYLMNAGRGSTNQLELSRETIGNCEFLVPEQQIATQAEKIMVGIHDKIRDCAMQNVRLREARDLLLPKLMSGEAV